MGYSVSLFSLLDEPLPWLIAALTIRKSYLTASAVREAPYVGVRKQ